MERRIGYRHATSLSLERRSADDEEVEIECSCGVRVERSAFGQLLVYREHLAYGQTLAAAVELGWCRVVTDTPAQDE
jgi:hypothetical protein